MTFIAILVEYSLWKPVKTVVCGWCMCMTRSGANPCTANMSHAQKSSTKTRLWSRLVRDILASQTIMNAPWAHKFRSFYRCFEFRIQTFDRPYDWFYSISMKGKVSDNAIRLRVCVCVCVFNFKTWSNQKTVNVTLWRANTLTHLIARCRAFHGQLFRRPFPIHTIKTESAIHISNTDYS